MAFNKKEYISKYKKEHYSKLSVDLTKEQKQELINVCNQHSVSIKQFILDSIQRAKNNK